MKRRLFTPISVGGVMLKNRIVFAPFEHNTATEEGFVTPATLDFYRRVASGGVGLIITGATNINRNRQLKWTKYICDLGHDKYIPGQQKLAEVIHREGAKCFVQIADKSLLGKVKMPADLSEDEIYEMIEAHVDGAKRAKEAGFDGVDFHWAHVYSVFQFLSNVGNKRTDQWGGSVEENARIAVEILRRTKETVGPYFPLSPRFSAEEFRPKGNTLKHMAPMSRLFVEAGADMLDVSAGAVKLTFSDTNRFILEDTKDEADAPFGTWAHLAEGVKKAVRSAVPVMTVRMINSPQLAEELLIENKADLIGIGRGLLIDPWFPKKAEEGRDDEIIECQYCGFCHREYRQSRIPYCCVLAKMEKEGSEEAKRLSLESILRSRRE